MMDVKKYLDEEGMIDRSRGNIKQLLSELKGRDVDEWLTPILESFKEGDEAQKMFYNAMAERLGNSTVYDLFKSVHYPRNVWTLNKLMRYADFRGGERVLDVGCGTGLEATLMGKRVGNSGEVVGIDVSEEMIKRAEERAKKRGLDNTKFVEGTRFKMPFEDNIFDFVSCLSSFTEGATSRDHETGDFWVNYCAVETAKEMHRVLKKGGRLGLYQPCRGCFEVESEEDYDFFKENRNYSLDRCIGYLESGGFRILDSEVIDFEGEGNSILLEGSFISAVKD